MNEKTFRKAIKAFLPKSLFLPLRELWRKIIRFESIEKNQQNLFLQRYKELSKIKNPKNTLRNNEFKVYSQNGEDGIIAYIFSKIGVTNNCFAEIGIEDGRESNTANLSINFGWEGLLIDGDKDNVANAKDYYENILKIKESQVKIVLGFVTKENINDFFLKNKVKKDIDFLSIDIDGNDYWVWEALTAIKPRVVSIEYNPVFGPKESLTTSYDPEFMRLKKHPSGLYQGASLAALTKLGKSKGYSLICCDSSGCNAFFVLKKEIKNIKELSVEEAYYPSSRMLRRFKTKDYERINYLEFEKIKHLDFDYV